MSQTILPSCLLGSILFLGATWASADEAVAPPAPVAEEAVVSASEEKPAVEPGTEHEDAQATPEGETDKPRKKRVRSTPLRAKLPKGVFGAPEPESPASDATLLGGTVPAIWEIERSSPDMEDDNLPSILDRDSIAPTVPAKVVRYALSLMQRYDLNADGVLQEEEWKKMPGTPQVIDLDGDSIIRLDELVRYLGLYGRDRTIHRPYPVERYHQPQMVSSQFQLFKPVTPAEVKPEPEVKETPIDPATTADLSEEAMKEEETPVDDATYEEIIAGRQVPAEKKYHTPPEALRGVPAWFLIRDRDGDGQVSLTEFAPTLSAKALALFGQLDKNGDGFITPDEVRQTPPPAP